MGQIKFGRGTPTQYSNLATKDSNEVYFVNNSSSPKDNKIYLGDKLMSTMDIASLYSSSEKGTLYYSNGSGNQLASLVFSSGDSGKFLTVGSNGELDWSNPKMTFMQTAVSDANYYPLSMRYTTNTNSSKYIEYGRFSATANGSGDGYLSANGKGDVRTRSLETMYDVSASGGVRSTAYISTSGYISADGDLSVLGNATIGDYGTAGVSIDGGNVYADGSLFGFLADTDGTTEPYFILSSLNHPIISNNAIDQTVAGDDTRPLTAANTMSLINSSVSSAQSDWIIDSVSDPRCVLNKPCVYSGESGSSSLDSVVINRTVSVGDSFGDHSVSENNGTATGSYSHAEGYDTLAFGVDSHAEGAGSGSNNISGFTVSGPRDATEYEANDTSRISVGDMLIYGSLDQRNYPATVVSITDSTHFTVSRTLNSDSKLTDASLSRNLSGISFGNAAHSEGVFTIAGGEGSHSEGLRTISHGGYSHAEGEKTYTTNSGEHAEGMFNLSNTGQTNADKTISSIGIGSVAGRKNALEVMLNGDIYVYGVGGYDGTNPSTSTTLQDSLSDSENMVSLEYSELVYKVNHSELIPGMQYRIIDYTCTTTQTNTSSASHVFDIIVTADSETELSEIARAAHHSGDTYFANCDLDSWELKYCIENDTNRFAWADSTNGKGIIYYMKDEWNNECPYDFKNIMFKRWAVTEVTDSVLDQDTVDALNEIFVFDGSDNSKFQARFGYQENNCTYGSTTHVVDAEDSGWYYTFSIIMNDTDSGEFAIDNIEDGSIKGNNFYNDEGGGGFHGNSMKPRYNNMASDEGGIDGAQVLNNIVFNGYYENSEEAPYIYACFMNHLGGNCYDNTFGNDCYYNSFGNNCYRNSFGNYCYNNSFGNSCQYNSFGNSCFSNSFGNDCGNNSFGNNCYRNSFGNNCWYNSFGNEFQNNSFGNGCYYNSFGNEFQNNSFGNDCRYNSFGNYCQNITVFDGVQYCSVTGGASNAPIKNAQILNGTAGASAQNKLTITFSKNKDYTQVAGLVDGTDLRIWIAEDEVTGPTTATDNHIALFDGTTGKVIKDGGLTVSELQAGIPSPADAAPLMDGTATVGSSTDYAREDHIHPKDTSKADKVSGATAGNFAGLDSNGNLTDSEHDASELVPSGGTTGQVLAKHSNTDNDVEWVTQVSPTEFYWANQSVQSSVSYATTPEFQQVTINGDSAATVASTDHCIIVYDTTNKCLKFTF